MTDATRRRLMTAAGALAVGGVTSLGGCAEILDGGSTSVPDPGSPTYRKWIPEHTGPDGYGEFLYEHADHDRLRANRDRDLVPGGFDEGLKHKVWMDHFGVGYDRIRTTLVAVEPFAMVAAGDFSRGEVVEGLGPTGYDEEASYRGYPVFGRPEHSRRIAAGEGVVVTAGGEDAGRAARRWIDLIERDGTPFHEADDLFAATTDRAGGYPFVGLGNAETWAASVPGRIVAKGHAFEDARSFTRFVAGFGTVDEVDPDAVRETLTHSFGGRGGRIVDSTTEGRVASATGAVDPPGYAEAFGEGDVAAGDYPLATFGATYDADAGAVTLRHEAGEAVPADALTVRVNGEAAGRQFSGEVTPGDAVTVGVNPGEEADVVWRSQGEGPSRSAVWASYTVPERSATGSRHPSRDSSVSSAR